ncbi:MAG TPA: ribonuclease HI family protein [Acidobacteriaceae bacterium]|nr:ribonuclease HI family protein [Acidobacteriaceae bacterium]
MTDAAQSGGIVAYCDGGSRGNPGPSGYGVSIEDTAGHPIADLSEFLGVKTNNFAEYSGLLAALEYALAHGYPQLRVIADSELMVKQMKGQYRVNSPELRPLWEEAKRRVAGLERFEIQHVLRGKNKRADALANQAMDRGTGKTVRELGGREGGGQPTSSPSSAATRPHLVTSTTMRTRPAETRPTETRPTETRATTATQAERPRTAQPADKRALKGFVKNGVVHLLEGELPENCFVRVTPE